MSRKQAASGLLSDEVAEKARDEALLRAGVAPPPPPPPPLAAAKDTSADAVTGGWVGGIGGSGGEQSGIKLHSGKVAPAPLGTAAAAAARASAGSSSPAILSRNPTPQSSVSGITPPGSSGSNGLSVSLPGAVEAAAETATVEGGAYGGKTPPSRLSLGAGGRSAAGLDGKTPPGSPQAAAGPKGI